MPPFLFLVIMGSALLLALWTLKLSASLSTRLIEARLVKLQYQDVGLVIAKV
jgi:hypothetical protein